MQTEVVYVLWRDMHLRRSRLHYCTFCTFVEKVIPFRVKKNKEDMLKWKSWEKHLIVILVLAITKWVWTYSTRKKKILKQKKLRHADQLMRGRALEISNMFTMLKVLGKTSYCYSCACYHKMSVNLLNRKEKKIKS